MASHAPPGEDAIDRRSLEATSGARGIGSWLPFLGGVALYLAFLAGGWLMLRAGLVEMDPCFSDDVGDLCYCERFRSGLIKQPANTWSNLAFAVVGFGVLADLAISPRREDNRMRRERFYTAWYGLLALYLGPGSMVFHASYTWWAGILDGVAMYVWLSFVLVYNLVRLFEVSRLVAFSLWAAINVSWFALRVTLPNEGSAVSTSTLLFVTLLCVMLASNVAVLLRGRERVALSSHGWLGASLLCFGCGMAVWLQSGTGQPLCKPESLWQGHAAWHLCAALAVGALYLYLRHSADAPGRGVRRNA